MSGFAGEPPTPADQTNPPPALESLRRPRYPVPWRNLRRRRQPSVLGLGETPGDYANFNCHQPRDATRRVAHRTLPRCLTASLVTLSSASSAQPSAPSAFLFL